MSKILEENKFNDKSDRPPYKCKCCGMGDIEQEFDICKICGWEDDRVQNNESNFVGGANEMSLNQYKKFWYDCKSEILKNLKSNRFYAIEKSQEYYDKNFKQQNEKYHRKINPHYDEDQKKFAENRLKNKMR